MGNCAKAVEIINFDDIRSLRKCLKGTSNFHVLFSPLQDVLFLLWGFTPFMLSAQDAVSLDTTQHLDGNQTQNTVFFIFSLKVIPGRHHFAQLRHDDVFSGFAPV